MRYEVVIPFTGFYESLHNATIEDALEQMFSDSATGCYINEDLKAYADEKMNWRAVFIDYAKEYLVNFADWLELDLEWGALWSPREYNFMSDRIDATISEESLLRAYEMVDKGKLSEVARARHTSYDGFISFYNPDVSTWGPVTEWEAQQICTLLTALAIDIRGEWDGWTEHELMESDVSNGVIDDIVYRNCPGIEHLLRIKDYLELRAQREGVTA